MATMEKVETLSFEAGGDLSADQFKFVLQDATDKQVDLVGTLGTVQATGVLLNAPSAAGQAATVGVGGVVKVIANAAGVLAGAKVSADAAGLAITSVAGATTALGYHVLGIAQNDAAGGELLEVRLDNQGILTVIT